MSVPGRAPIHIERPQRASVAQAMNEERYRDDELDDVVRQVSPPGRQRSGGNGRRWGTPGHARALGPTPYVWFVSASSGSIRNTGWSAGSGRAVKNSRAPQPMCSR